MAGRPKRRLLLMRIKELGGFDALFDRIAEGEPLSTICKDYGVNARFLKVVATENDKLAALFKQARADAAAALVEKNLEELETFKPSSLQTANAEVSLLKLRAEHRKWLAGIYDRAVFGEERKNAGVNVTLDLGALHLAALRGARQSSVRRLESGEVSAEVVDGEG